MTPGASSIQAAVDASAPGDTVLVSPGTYSTTQRVFLNKGVAILSSGGPAVTVVDLQYNFGPVFAVLNAATPPTIEGLTIERGANIFTGAGGGIYVENASPIIRDCLIQANGATNLEGIGGGGGGIGVRGGNPIIENNTIVANWSGSGGIYLESSAATVDHNVIAYNSSFDQLPTEGFGISCVLSTGASIHDNLFWANLPTDLDGSCASVASNNVFAVNPQFCAPGYPNVASNHLDQLDWRVFAGSPAAPGGAYGTWGAARSTCPATASTPTTWGHLKAQYR